jgi:ATP-dependent protease ClpP protease subunit
VRNDEDLEEINSPSDPFIETVSRGIGIHAIDVPLGAHLRQGLMQFAHDDPTLPITLYFNSYGGDVWESLVCADAIDEARNRLLEYAPIIGKVTGHAESAAVYILQQCDWRTITAHSHIMIHGTTDCAHNHDHRTRDAARKMQDRLNETYVEFFTARTKKPRKFWEGVMGDSHPLYLSAQEALQMGLVDEVIPTWTPKKHR